MRHYIHLIFILILITVIFPFGCKESTNNQLIENKNNQKSEKPNIILVMSDDQGWGQMGYYNHPILKTPHLDEMAKNGLRFDRFYAGSPLCSPTRATVMTGRSNDRTAVLSHGFALRKQEKTIAQALKHAGYKTAHFGKWHLSGIQGPGIPILKENERSPGHFGFDEWLSVTNFFDMNPIMSRSGEFEEMKGESSKIIVNEALQFIKKEKDNGKPLFVVIWYGSPHSPFLAEDKSKLEFQELEPKAQDHYGELHAIDESIGTLRQELRNLNVADNTLVWYNSDNGGLPGFVPETVGGLRGFKKDMYEGGIRVPAIIEWPAVIKKARITDFPAVTMDIFPSLADIVGLANTEMTLPIDGISLKPLFEKNIETRTKPIPFRMKGKAAFIDNDYKLVCVDIPGGKYELYNLKKDPTESDNIFESEAEIAIRLIKEFKEWNQSVEKSFAGKDYKEGIAEPDGGRTLWVDIPAYDPFIESWSKRLEYKDWIKRQKNRVR